MAEIIAFNGETREDIDPDQVLMAATSELDCVLVLGFTKRGSLYVAASDGELGKILVLMEAGKAALLDEAFE